MGEGEFQAKRRGWTGDVWHPTGQTPTVWARERASKPSSFWRAMDDSLSLRLFFLPSLQLSPFHLESRASHWSGGRHLWLCRRAVCVRVGPVAVVVVVEQYDIARSIISAAAVSF